MGPEGPWATAGTMQCPVSLTVTPILVSDAGLVLATVTCSVTVSPCTPDAEASLPQHGGQAPPVMCHHRRVTSFQPSVHGPVVDATCPGVTLPQPQQVGTARPHTHRPGPARPALREPGMWLAPGYA